MNWRAASVVAGLLVLFVVSVRTVWLRCAGTAVSYELRRLLDEEAEVRNHNDALEVDVARKKTGRRIAESRQRLELEGFERHEAATLSAVPRTQGDGASH